MTDSLTPSNLITVFADASWSLGAGGYAYWARADSAVRVQGSAPWPCTGINEAETVGLSVALMEALDAFPVNYGGSVVLQSDSLIALGCFRTLGGGVPTRNTDRPIFPLPQVHDIPRAFVEKSAGMASALGLRIWLKHVKAHTGHDAARSQVNAWCDAEAKRARKLCAVQMKSRSRNPHPFPPKEAIHEN